MKTPTTIQRLLNSILLHPEHKDTILSDFSKRSYSKFRALGNLLERQEFDFVVKVLTDFSYLQDDEINTLLDLIYLPNSAGSLFEDEQGQTWVYNGIFNGKPIARKLGETNVEEIDPSIKISRIF